MTKLFKYCKQLNLLKYRQVTGSLGKSSNSSFCVGFGLFRPAFRHLSFKPWSTHARHLKGFSIIESSAGSLEDDVVLRYALQTSSCASWALKYNLSKSAGDCCALSDSWARFASIFASSSIKWANVNVTNSQFIHNAINNIINLMFHVISGPNMTCHEPR